VQKDLPRARALLPVLRAERPDLVHLGNSIKANMDGVVAARWAGVPCIAHEKGLVRYTPFERLWARAVDTTVCMTDAVREHLIAQGVRGTRLEVVHDGLDLTKFQPTRERGEMRTSLGLAPGDLAVGMAVNVQPWKGQDVTLKAVAALAAEFPTLKCLLAGGVVRGAEWFQERLQEFIRGQGLAGRVQFLGSRADVPDLLNALDVVVHASVTPEPFGRILIEAMALGKPLVASAAGGVLEIVEDGRSGLLVPPGDAVALAAALRRLLSDPALREATGAAGRKRAYDHFSVEPFAHAIQEVYDQVLRA
jgi:glycosyltransferase involved in cell wall biosynthesis